MKVGSGQTWRWTHETNVGTPRAPSNQSVGPAVVPRDLSRTKEVSAGPTLNRMKLTYRVLTGRLLFIIISTYLGLTMSIPFFLMRLSPRLKVLGRTAGANIRPKVTSIGYCRFWRVLVWRLPMLTLCLFLRAHLKAKDRTKD